MKNEAIDAFQQSLFKLSSNSTLPVPQMESVDFCNTVRFETNSEKFDMYVIDKNELTDTGLDTLQDIVALKTPFITLHVPGDSMLQSKLLNRKMLRKPSILQNSSFRKNSTHNLHHMKKKKDSELTEDYNNLSGSPLKLQAIADFSISCFDSPDNMQMNIGIDDIKELKMYPQLISSFSVAKARLFASLYTLAVRKECLKGRPVHPMWILCDGSHIKPYILIGIEKLEENEHALKTTHVTIEELAKCESHFPILTESNLAGKQVTCKGIYNICQYGSEYEVEEKTFSYQGFVQVELDWDKSMSTAIPLLHKPPGNAKSVVRAGVASGDMRSGIYMIYRELDILKSFIDGFESGEVTWVTERSGMPLIDDIKQLLEQLKLGDSGNNMSLMSNDEEIGDEKGNTEFSMKVAPLIIEERKDKDFTDHLWDILINCTSHSELMQCLKHVLKVLSNGELQPLVHRSNQTTLAQYVRDSYSGRLIVPPLTGLHPLHLLAEIGIEKLANDYTHAFVSKDMLTIASLQYFISQNLELTEKLERLEKLHNVLEMIAMLKIYLKLPISSLSICARQMLQYYERHPIDPSHVFQFSVQTSDIIDRISLCPPWIWNVEASCQIGSTTQQELYYLTNNQPFIHLSLPKFPGTDLADKENDHRGQSSQDIDEESPWES